MMPDLTLDPERVRAAVDQIQADLGRLYGEINDLDAAADELRREACMLEDRLKVIRERFGIPAEASDA